MRPQDFLPQFRGPKFLDLDLIASGVRWCLWGLVQKVAADRLAMRVDPLFDGTPVTVVAAWTGAVAFSIQIYLDFAGYSNIAVGLGYLFGYRMDRNFNQPYAAVDASDFWSRWHITLSTWLRDYLYIPLGGNRGTRAATFRNLMITMTLGGLWHGASWNFVLWGVLHGVLLCGFRARPIAPWSRLASRAILLLSVVALWVPFRARTLTATATMWRAMTGFGAARGAWHQWLELALLCAVFGAIHAMENVILGTPERQRRALQMWQKVPSMARGTVAAAVLFACNLALVDGTTFIYFRF
jgi:alginate O-acetyltransferase complex protein AlgI